MKEEDRSHRDSADAVETGFVRKNNPVLCCWDLQVASDRESCVRDGIRGHLCDSSVSVGRASSLLELGKGSLVAYRRPPGVQRGTPLEFWFFGGDHAR
jgi:hypothetical protein